MRKTIAVLAVLAGLAVPTTASATGNHIPPQPSAPKTCACCADLNQRIDQLELVFNQKITALEQRITNLEQTIANLQIQITQVDQRVTNIINTPDPLRCTSGRVYVFTLRRDVEGVAVAQVRSVVVAGVEKRGSAERRPNGRFRITADYRGITAPSGQLRTVTINATLANGQRVRLTQLVRLCLERDGNPNDTPAQDRAGR